MSYCSRPWRDRRSTNPNSIGTQLQVLQLGQSLQPFDPRDLVLREEQLRQFREVRDILNMLDLVEAQIQALQIAELIEPFDVGNEVIVKVQVNQVRSNVRGELNSRNLILAQA